LDPINSWSWQFGDGNTSSQQSPTHNFGANGNYVVCLTIVTVNGCASTYCDTVLVESCGPATNLQTLNTSNTTASLSWSDENTNKYKVQYKCTSCPGSSVQNKIVFGGNNNTILHNLTPCSTYRWRVLHKCDGQIYRSALASPFTTSGCRLANPDIEDKLSIYPNPVKDEFVAKYFSPREQVVTVSIFDLIGRVIYQKEIKALVGENEFEMNVSNLESGIYMLNVDSGERSVSEKFVVSE
jgi:hypothetical protein